MSILTNDNTRKSTSSIFLHSIALDIFKQPFNNLLIISIQYQGANYVFLGPKVNSGMVMGMLFQLSLRSFLEVCLWNSNTYLLSTIKPLLSIFVFTFTFTFTFNTLLLKFGEIANLIQGRYRTSLVSGITYSSYFTSVMPFIHRPHVSNSLSRLTNSQMNNFNSQISDRRNSFQSKLFQFS